MSLAERREGLNRNRNRDKKRANQDKKKIKASKEPKKKKTAIIRRVSVLRIVSFQFIRGLEGEDAETR